MEGNKIAFETVLQRINKYITLKDEDRAAYTRDFDAVIGAITHEMKNEDPVFKSLYNGPNLGGSYADKLKVSKPDEFDLVLRLKLTANRYVKVERHKRRPGYVKINLTDVFKTIKNQTQNKIIYEKLSKLVNEENYLVQNELQAWIESILTKVLQKHNNCFTKNGKTYRVDYVKTGPAHTIKLKYENRFMSIDLVPGIVFDKSKWLSNRRPPEGAKTDWIAVPKPIKNSSGPNISFQTSYVDTERFYIDRKNNLKNTLRMIKKLRDKYNIQNLKSYFIKTVFLWECAKQPSEFWNNSAGKILLHMMEKLVEHVEKGSMPFFWDINENMFAGFSDTQIQTMCGQLKGIQKLIVKYSTTDTNKLYEVFLTKEEIQDMQKQSVTEKMHKVKVVEQSDSMCSIA